MKESATTQSLGLAAVSDGTKDHNMSEPIILKAQSKSGSFDEKHSKEDPELSLKQAPSDIDSGVGASMAHEEVKLYCLCRTTDENNMIGCDKCDEWYHFACVGIDVVRTLTLFLI